MLGFLVRQALKNISPAFIQSVSQAMHSAEEGQLDCKICKMMLSSQVFNCLTILSNLFTLLCDITNLLHCKCLLIYFDTLQFTLDCFRICLVLIFSSVQKFDHFSPQEELMTHLKVHAGSRTMKGSLDKKFVCGQCDKKFFTRKVVSRYSSSFLLQELYTPFLYFL